VTLELRPQGLLHDAVRLLDHHHHRRAEVDHAPALPVRAAGKSLRPDRVEPARAQADADEADVVLRLVGVERRQDPGGGHVTRRTVRDVGAEAKEALAAGLAADEAVGEPRQSAMVSLELHRQQARRPANGEDAGVLAPVLESSRINEE